MRIPRLRLLLFAVDADESTLGWTPEVIATGNLFSIASATVADTLYFTPHESTPTNDDESELLSRLCARSCLWRDAHPANAGATNSIQAEV